MSQTGGGPPSKDLDDTETDILSIIGEVSQKGIAIKESEVEFTFDVSIYKHNTTTTYMNQYQYCMFPWLP